MLPERLKQTSPHQKIATVTADGAYDTRRCHNEVAAREAAAIIPPRKMPNLGSRLQKVTRYRKLIPGNTFPHLSLAVSHGAFEPASSLLSRLAARNGASSMQRFCGNIAFPIDSLFRRDKVAIEQLAQLAGCDMAPLERVGARDPDFDLKSFMDAGWK